MNEVKSKFVVGDVVVLKSGSPAMTIGELEYNLNIQTGAVDKFTGYVTCQWFVGNKAYDGKYHQDTLEKK